MNFDSLPDVLSVPETSKLIGISKGKVYDLIRKNELPATKLGKRIVIAKKELISFLNPSAKDSNQPQRLSPSILLYLTKTLESQAQIIAELATFCKNIGKEITPSASDDQHIHEPTAKKQRRAI